MINLTRVALAGVFALGLGAAAQAQTFSPKVPDFAHPNPANPIATDGTALPRSTFNNDGLYSGRSAFVDPVTGVVGSAVGTSVGVARGAVDTGLAIPGAVLDGNGDIAR